MKTEKKKDGDPKKGNNYEPVEEQQLEREKPDPKNKKKNQPDVKEEKEEEEEEQEEEREVEEIEEDRDVYNSSENPDSKNPLNRNIAEVDELEPELDGERKGKVTNKEEQIVNKHV